MPFGSDEVVMIKAAGLIVMLSVLLAVTLAASVTVTEKLNVPGAFGKPEITPPPLSVRPAGAEPLHV